MFFIKTTSFNGIRDILAGNIRDMRRLWLLVLMVQSFVAAAQIEDGILAVMRFSGVTSPEELDVYEVERLEELLHIPLRVNASRRSDLEKSGLFNQFQIASLLDYRTRHGDILSFTELAAVDGFSQDIVQTISPFISLESHGSIGVSAKKFRQELAVKTGYKNNSDHFYLYGGKYKLTSDKICLGLSLSRPYDASANTPEYISGNISWNHALGKVVVGDFNARFGQGICLWNSALLSSLSLPSAYMRKPTGVSVTNSFTGSMALTGLASDLQLGQWKLSAMLAFPGVKEAVFTQINPAVNIARYGRIGQVSMTHLMEFTNVLSYDFRIPQMKTSVDGALNINGVNIFGESAVDWVNKTVAAVFGTDFMATDKLRLAFLAKYYPAAGFSNDYGVSASGEFGLGRLKGNFSLEGSYYPKPKSKTQDRCIQLKAQTEWVYNLTDRFTMELRIKERYRNWDHPYKTDIRIGIQYKSDKIVAITRINSLSCDDVGLLGYFEGGYTPERMSAYLRFGLFKVDDWDDRIYVYERDAPSSFNVPAYYGRGYWISSYLSWRPVKWLAIYFRASYVSYIFMSDEKRKPGKAELRIQGVIKF